MSIRVVARIRPLLAKEHDKDVIVRADSSEDGSPPTIVKIPSPKNEAEEFSFAFNGVYDQATTQEELFNTEVAPHIKSLFQGLDLTLFAYGVTGTGKTHTMRGGLKLADRGVIPRLLSHVFRRGKKIAKDSGGATTVDVALAYYEIYNDKVYDLLEPPEKRTPTGLPLREKDGKTFVVGLSEQSCVDLRDFERLYIAANQNRITAATKLNAHSSRSHAILRVKVTQTTRSPKADGSGTVLSVRESTASAIDLAGSEDNRRTDNGKERLVESAAINKSLFVLSQCVDAIARGEKRIPYRESKMTRILSLGQNNGITVMILNLAPVRSYHLDTISSLNVSSRAKRIEVREIENEVVFKLPPRSTTMPSLAANLLSTSTTAAAGLARQPLRPLTTSEHNAHTGVAAASKASSDNKPVKTFAVYTDRVPSKPLVTAASPPPPPPASATHAMTVSSSRMRPLRTLPNNGTKSGKRPSRLAEPRPSKLARPSIHPYSAARAAAASMAPASAPVVPPPAAAPVLSTEQIEAIIERKVAEALAVRAAQEEQEQRRKENQRCDPRRTPTPVPTLPPLATSITQQVAPAPGINEDVQKRLEALERRIERSTREDDPRAEGLQCLLLARQHKEVGDDATALQYYEQALPFFPGQAKLLSKIEKLRAKLAREAGASLPTFASASMLAPATSPSPRKPYHVVGTKLLSQKRKRAAVATAMVAATATSQPTAQMIDEPVHDDMAVGQPDGSDADVEDGNGDGEDAEGVSTAEKRLSSQNGRQAKRAKAVCGGRKETKMAGTEHRHKRQIESGDGDEADDESIDGDMMPPRTPLTPRKRQLLEIVNSRDVARIRGLAGVGAKKARGLVAYLDNRNAENMDDTTLERFSPAPMDDGMRQIETLAELRTVPGMEKVVDRAFGLVAIV